MDGDLSSVTRHRDVLQRLGDREPTTQLEAQAVIESIRADKGYLDDETLHDLDSIPFQSRQNILHIIEKKREFEAEYTKSISEQLYSSKYRFFYELIQNADDSLYTTAQANKRLRTMRFTITRDTIIVETNEDGFTRANVDAICATGKSSKKATASDDHIGEKGFGFKSVFSIAHEVQIQSGVWSFCFRHRQGDDGLGMVTPLDAPFDVLPSWSTTRITLTLSETAEEEYERLLEELAEVPSTTIFFLQRLQQIKMDAVQLDSKVQRTTIRKRGSLSSESKKTTPDTVRISRTVSNDDEEETESREERAYHVFTRVIEDMPKDWRRKDRSSARIDLAFPIDTKEGQPQLDEFGQYVFAYLPLQRVSQMPFLIQSDFITSANRESIVDCAWNIAIRNGVARAFADAVSLTFAIPHGPLRHSWLAYLPTEPMDKFWKPLYPSIKNLLGTRSVIQTWQGGRFKCPSNVSRLLPQHLHEGEPIFLDTFDDIYLAPEYSPDHHTVLEDLGTSVISWNDLMRRVEADLVKTTSRLRTKPASDAWQESCANFLLHPFEQGNECIQQRLKRLAIIPLTGGNRWTGAPGFSKGGLGSVYFPHSNGVPIPQDISLNLVEPIAASNLRRKEFFRQLGVEVCSTSIVLSRIEATQKSPGLRSLIWKPQYRYLFHFHPFPELLKSWILVPTEMHGCARTTSPLYFPSKHEHDTYQLLPKSFFTKENVIVKLLNKELVDLVPPKVHQQNLSWGEWLKRATGARHHPPLTENTGTFTYKLSQVLLAVLEHNPNSFVGLLRAHWSEYSLDVRHVKPQLMECKVPCAARKRMALQSTYLPTEHILSRLNALGSPIFFPLLRLPDVLDETNQMEWQFLQSLGVHTDVDLNFYELLLSELRDDFDIDAEVSQENVMEIYISMARLATVDDQERLREFFESSEAVAVTDKDGNLEFRAPSECVWQGPDFLAIKTPLIRDYGKVPQLRTFFKVFLDIRDYNTDDLLDELEECVKVSTQAELIYKFLDTNIHADAEWKQIRESFSQRKLIIVHDELRHSLESCLWGTPFALADYEDLSKVYPDLENFFVKRLKVSNASPSMLINELVKMTQKKSPHVGDIRQRLVDIGRMITRTGIDADVSKALGRLKKVKFLPKKTSDDVSTLVGADDDFAVCDHERFGNAFSGQSVLLEFSIDESQILNKLLEHMDLTHRYLSNAVVEVSSVSENAERSELLSRQLQYKAYAMYCCAARYKSVKALRGEPDLFHQLSQAEVFLTDDISTELVLNFTSGPVKVKSDRLAVHHEMCLGFLRIFVPNDQRERKRCWRSQLPHLLSNIIGVSSGATHAISLVLSSDYGELDEILAEQDVAEVDWVEKPTVRIPTALQTEIPSLLQSPTDPLDPNENSSVTLSQPPTPDRTISTPDTTPHSNGRPSRPFPNDEIQGYPQTPQYERMVEQVLRSAQRAAYGRRPASPNHVPVRGSAPIDDSPPLILDHVAAFGDRDTNEMAHDRKIGAAGEAYVFEILSNLNLARFDQNNWQSTIRGEVQGHRRFADIRDWSGRETADLVYMDRDGSLSRYSRQSCFGGFPDGIREDRDFATHPIEYFLEVKTTTSACETRFFMSGSQYQRMQNLAVPVFGDVRKVYVIFRVFNLGPRTEMRTFVDPFRFRDRYIDFKVGTWFCKVKDAI